MSRYVTGPYRTVSYDKGTKNFMLQPLMAVSQQDKERGTKRQATEACTRALLACEARRHAIDSLEGHPLASANVHAPLAADGSDDLARGWNDCMAFLHAYHDKALHRDLRPTDGLKVLLFDVMEYERCLSVGAEHYRGAGKNILRFRQDPKSADVGKTVQDQLVEQMSTLIRSALAMQAITTSTITQHPAMQRLAETFMQIQTSFRDSKTDQHAFSQLSLSVLALLEAEYDLNTGGAAAGLAGDESEERLGGGTNMQGSSEQSEEQSSDGLNEEAEQLPSELLAIESDEANELDQHHAIDDAASVSSTSGEAAASKVGARVSYRAYTTAQDEIVDAAELELTQELSIYRKQLDTFIGKHGSIVNRLSARLRQLLLAQQRSSWAFDQEEGTLDTSRLYRVVTTPSYPLTFKVEVESLFKDTTVCVLIDNSKSMVGKPIATAAACADILTQTLERCGVSVEILGFTTTELHGSGLLAKWQSEGADGSPGRMNGIRHIIYKNGSTPYRRASINLGAMLDRELLKQNIDGEALIWAYERLRVKPNARKILMVISDGAPLDASTLTANPKDYLVAHLRESIARVESDRCIELCAIGINHDVSHYYMNAVSIHDARDLGKALLAQLSELFRR